MKNFKIIRETSVAAAEAAAGELLNSMLESKKNQPVLLLLAGGSALKVLDYIGQNSLAQNLTVCVSDDRFSQEPEINNFLQLQKTDFYALAQDADVSFFGTLPRPNEKMEETAKRWEYNLRKWKEENPNGWIIALLGMGPDGHTAGMFPYPEDEGRFKQLFESEDWIAAYDALGKHKYHERLTATATFLEQTNEIILFACGPEKKQKIDQLANRKGSLPELPALVIYSAKTATLITDQE